MTAFGRTLRAHRRAWWLMLVLPLSGCAFSPSADVIRELAKDPATVSVTIMTPYGSMKWLRSNPGEKSDVQMDGNSLTIKRQ